MREEKIISKGVYGFSQISGFISVKNYIFLHSDDKICLALRFSNDTEYTFDSMSFYLIQLDAKGKILCKNRVEYNNISFKPGELYVPDRFIEVGALCVDFKIQFCEAYSGFYRYAVRNRKVIIYYDRKRAAEAKENSLPETPAVTVTKKENGKPKLTALITVLAVLLMFAFNALYLYSLYYKATQKDGKEKLEITDENFDIRENIHLGVEYAEI